MKTSYESDKGTGSRKRAIFTLSNGIQRNNRRPGIRLVKILRVNHIHFQSLNSSGEVVWGKHTPVLGIPPVNGDMETIRSRNDDSPLIFEDSNPLFQRSQRLSQMLDDFTGKDELKRGISKRKIFARCENIYCWA